MDFQLKEGEIVSLVCLVYRLAFMPLSHTYPVLSMEKENGSHCKTENPSLSSSESVP